MSKRISKEKWIRHGLSVLSENGSTALKADPLCKLLGVTRGSFYWHFKNIDVYHHALTEQWQKITTQRIIDDVNSSAENHNKLHLLMLKALTSDNLLERAIRAWAAHKDSVAEVVFEVDKMRFSYLTQILDEAGVSPDQIKPRAAFIYWAALGRILAGSSAGELDESDLEILADMFVSK